MTLSIAFYAVGLTLLIFILSLVVGTVLGALVCAARMSKLLPARYLAMVWIAVIRGVPSLVWLFIVFFGITIQGQGLPSLSAAILTFSVISSAHLAEAFRTGFEAVPAGQYQALQALAVPRWASLRKILIPQALPVTCAAGISFAIHLLKDTALASVIGVTEITFIANDLVQRGGDGLVTFLGAGALYLLLSIPLGLLAHRLSKRFKTAKGVN